jgi:signal transduction histidine kinase
MAAHRTSDPGVSGADALHTQRLALLGRLAGFLSHELRNPLNAIFLHLDVVEEEVRQAPPAGWDQIERSLATIKGEVSRLHELMQEYLALARLSDAACQPEEMRPVLEAAARDAQGALAAQQILLHLEGAENLGRVAMQKPLLSRAIAQVIQRAASAVPPGGTLRVRHRPTASHLHLALYSADRPLQVQIGTSEEAALHWAVVEDIISAHGGTLEAHETPVEGTMYTLMLPLHREES